MGIASVEIKWPEPEHPADSLAGFQTAQSDAIEKQGYKLDEKAPRSITYKRRHLSTLGFVIGLLLFPIGILVWIFYRQEESFTVLATPDEGGSLISVQGQVRPKLRSSLGEFAQMRTADFERDDVDDGSEAEPEEELRRIYDVVGRPEAFGEAKEKVLALAGRLSEQSGCTPDEGLRLAYERSLAEHRDYLAARGIPEPTV